MRNVICTSDATGIGHCSQSVRGGGFIFVSGQLALDPVTQQIIEGDASQQTERGLQNLVAVLKAAGSSLDSVVRCGVSLKNMDDFAAMNAVYDKIFGPHPPARTTVEAARLPKDSPVEIDAIALEYEKSSRPERELPRMKTGDCRGGIGPEPTVTIRRASRFGVRK
jgi:2-iminobutanoate/2-iminopropanoate deaminase